MSRSYVVTGEEGGRGPLGRMPFENVMGRSKKTDSWCNAPRGLGRAVRTRSRGALPDPLTRSEYFNQKGMLFRRIWERGGPSRPFPDGYGRVIPKL
jgi:hypothetical protein